MVSLELMRASNSRVAASLPAGLVAVFVGATSGIGETTLKQFAKQAQQPRIYFLGRRESEGKRIQAELKHLNPAGEYHSVQNDASLLKNVDNVCRYLQGREGAINLLFLSCGSLITKKQTGEGLHYPMALAYCARTRFIVNLLPQLKHDQIRSFSEEMASIRGNRVLFRSTPLSPHNLPFTHEQFGQTKEFEESLDEAFEFFRSDNDR